MRNILDYNRAKVRKKAKFEKLSELWVSFFRVMFAMHSFCVTASMNRLKLIKISDELNDQHNVIQ